MAPETVWLDRMTTPQVKQALEDGYRTVLLAVGSTEQQGPLIGDKLVERVALGLGKTLVAPTIRVGMSEHHMVFHGSMTLREEVLEEVLVDYGRSLARHGFQKSYSCCCNDRGCCACYRRSGSGYSPDDGTARDQVSL